MFNVKKELVSAQAPYIHSRYTRNYRISLIRAALPRRLRK